jgi:predicted HicB family RNase H-like nuclease
MGRAMQTMTVTPPRKTAAISLRLYPHIKEAAERAAKEERRSLSDWINQLLVEHCNRNRDLELRP